MEREKAALFQKWVCLPVRMFPPPLTTHPLSQWRGVCQQLGTTMSVVLFLDIMGASARCSTALKRRVLQGIEPNGPLESSNTMSARPIQVSVTSRLITQYTAMITLIRIANCMISVSVSLCFSSLKTVSCGRLESEAAASSAKLCTCGSVW